ncbi:MAG: maleylpyruvate isomerase N-terminal domain-containing protein, partial [Acidimicrobiales bacterium]
MAVGTGEVERAVASAAEAGGLRTPSLLPGWTQAHVVTHLARNADGLVNLLAWARTGIQTPMYVSWQRRNEDI